MGATVYRTSKPVERHGFKAMVRFGSLRDEAVDSIWVCVSIFIDESGYQSATEVWFIYRRAHIDAVEQRTCLAQKSPQPMDVKGEKLKSFTAVPVCILDWRVRLGRCRVLHSILVLRTTHFARHAETYTGEELMDLFLGQCSETLCPHFTQRRHIF